MDILHPAIVIPLVCVALALWILCCYLGRKSREAEEWVLRPANSQSVYIIPVYEEEREDEEAMEIYQACFQPNYRDPPMYCSGNVSPPPPYRFEPPSYQDPPPSYTDLLHLPPPPHQTHC